MNTTRNEHIPEQSVSGRLPISHLLGMVSLSSALLVSAWDVTFSIIPLALFVIISFIAPFFTGTGYYLPVITRGNPSGNVVSLTFDDGPDPISTPCLLTLLAEKKTTATFFVTGEHASRHPDLIRKIIREGHTIGNHSYHHDPLIMLKSAKRLFQEIQRTQALLNSYGIHPLAFRPPAGITNPKLGSILTRLGMYCVNYRCRAFDMGNRRIGNLSQKILRKIKPGDIILLHDIVPAKNKKWFVSDWLMEIETILDNIQKRGWKIIPLADLIQRPVMTSIQTVVQDSPHDFPCDAS
ncbi:MAG: polysaccharide deacetylase family protein [Desulfobacteraceae bacterium]|nr:MAG: polysaccharide deacetylase family protein [Desulfobacteraceae bacterium]